MNCCGFFFNSQEFLRRLKKSFGSFVVEEETENAEESTCMICCDSVKEKASLARKCLTTAFPCQGHSCSCSDMQICYGCYVETLWKSPRSQKGLGRFRASCPGCRAEYCQFDICYIEVKKKKNSNNSKKLDTAAKSNANAKSTFKNRTKLVRVFSSLEEAGDIEAFKKRQMEAPTDDKLEALIRSFLFGDNEELALPGLSNEERKVVHRLAEEAGIGHESKGEGGDRKIVLSKSKEKENFEISDDIICKGYLCLQGVSVDCAAAKYIEKVPPSWVAHRQKRDGSHHHITILSRKEMETLAIQRNEKKVSKAFLTEIIESIEKHVQNDWRVVGLGRVQEEENETLFLVLDWESMNHWKTKIMNMKERSYFHITLGFQVKDIHGVPKDRTTIF